jgi:hypothetical protein
MNRQTAIRLLSGSILVATFAAVPVFAQAPPPVPHGFHGDATVNGQPAPVGAQVEVRGAGVLTAIDCNPIAVTEPGRYGGSTPNEPRLCAQGQLEENQPLEFYIDGAKAECAEPGGSWQSSYPFQSAMDTTLNLRVGEAAQTSATPTSTATSTRAPADVATREEVVATATRRNPQATASPQAAAMATQTPSAVPAARPGASATAPGVAVVATPTGLAALAVTSSPAPTLARTASSRSMTPAPAIPTVGQPTSTHTPAIVAQAPRATSEPIIRAGTPLPDEQSSKEATPASGGADASSGRTVALWGGLAALAIAIAAGVILWLRGRPQ